MAVTTRKLIAWKLNKRPIVTLTAWDYPIARILDIAGVDVILVGDSLSEVILGHKNTLPVTLEEMIHHTAAVCRGVERALVVCDLPFLSYQISIDRAVESAGKILKQTGAGAVKLEGGTPDIVATIAKLTAIGIPVMAHLGLTPQSVNILGYQKQGKTDLEGQRIIDEAIAVMNAGAFAIVLENIPSELAAIITNKIPIPTIGIGAGKSCDGQVLVTADLLGLTEKQPPFAKSYTNLREIITKATESFITEVKDGKFPREED